MGVPNSAPIVSRAAHGGHARGTPGDAAARDDRPGGRVRACAADVALYPAANIAMVRVHGTSRAASCGWRFVTSLSG